MSITSKKIINSLLLIALAALITGLAYYFTGRERLLTGSILDGVTNPDWIAGVEFVNPIGVAYPVNDVVTIEQVYVDFKECSDFTVSQCPGPAEGCLVNGSCWYIFNYTDDFASGNDILGSLIYFEAETTTDCSLTEYDSPGTCPTDLGCYWDTTSCEKVLGGEVDISGNLITIPTGHYEVMVDIMLIGGTSNPVNDNTLIISQPDCSGLQTSIMKGLGTGMFTGDPADLPTSAVSLPFDFGDASAITSIILSNPPPPAEAGQQTFNITLDFVEGLIPRADITYNSGDGDYEIDVRDEGLSDTSGTASNFVYVFNDLLGSNSPFFASIDPLNSSGVILTTKELGIHTNDYNCNVNDLPFPDGTAHCLSGALVGIADVLTIPITLDNSMVQGETALIYAAGSVGDNEWISSRPSILEVALLSEAAEGPSESSAQFLTAPLTDTGDHNLLGGTYTVTDCVTPVSDTTCNIAMSIPVSFEAPTSLIAIVTVGGEDYDVSVQADGDLIGIIEGSGVWSDNSTTGGFNQTLTGTVLGTVTGYATGEIEGMVHGTITADVGGNAQLADNISGLGSSLLPTMGAMSATLLEEAGPFTSTVTTVEEVVTDIAILYAKRPGTTILTVTDAQHCIAALDIEVIGQAVILQMVDADPGDVFEVGDTVVINAYIGDEEGGIDETQNITTSTQWVSSNEGVATIDNGILTVIAPGITQITASYNTGVAEIGEIFSDPLTITVNQLTGLTIALDEDMLAMLPVEIVEQAYQSVLLSVHEPTVIGKTITVESQAIPVSSLGITFPGDANDIEKIDLIADALEIAIESITESASQVVNVTRLPAFPGILLMEPTAYQSTAGTGLMHNGIIDISTTANQNEVSIIPNFGAGIDLPADETYELMVVADYANGRTERLLATDVTWVNTPMNYLEQASLDTGLLTFGETAGESTVVAQFENADLTVIPSNLLMVTVEAGPVIDFIHRIGSGPITQGSQIDLQMKVTDVDTIADIQDISISIVDSVFDTYNQINSDLAATWFTATTYPSLIVVADEGTEGVLVFKIYNLPVDIPIASNLFDGDYKLIISITDTDNHTLNHVYPIYIGELASGDVNGDAVVNMIDVILAFQIAAGTITPTSAQLDAADINGQGGVTMVDVILLFQQASST